MKRLDDKPLKRRQHGAVLLLAMVFLLLMAIVAGTVMQTSILEFFMAGNEQFREEAFQQAQAISSELSEDLANFPVTGGIGYTICASGCDATFPRPPTSSLSKVPAGSTVTYSVRRRGPLFIDNLPFRQSENTVSSNPALDAAIFEADVEIDGSANRLGSAHVVQGIAVRVVSSAQ